MVRPAALETPPTVRVRGHGAAHRHVLGNSHVDLQDAGVTSLGQQPRRQKDNKH